MNYLDEVKAQRRLYLSKTLNSEMMCTYPSSVARSSSPGLVVATEGVWVGLARRRSALSPVAEHRLRASHRERDRPDRTRAVPQTAEERIVSRGLCKTQHELEQCAFYWLLIEYLLFSASGFTLLLFSTLWIYIN